MFLKARQWLRMMLLALVVQIGNLAKVGIRKAFEDKYGNQRQLRQVENDFKQGLNSKLNGPSRLTLDDPSEHQLSLTGRLEPASDLPTISLSSKTHLADPTVLHDWQNNKCGSLPGSWFLKPLNQNSTVPDTWVTERYSQS